MDRGERQQQANGGKRVSAGFGNGRRGETEIAQNRTCTASVHPRVDRNNVGGVTQIEHARFVAVERSGGSPCSRVGGIEHNLIGIDRELVAQIQW